MLTFAVRSRSLLNALYLWNTPDKNSERDVYINETMAVNLWSLTIDQFPIGYTHLLYRTVCTSVVHSKD